MTNHPYDIQKSVNSPDYYTDVKLVMQALHDCTAPGKCPGLDSYINFMHCREKLYIRSRGEYLLDLLLTGCLWRLYGEIATGASKAVLAELEILWRIRKRIPVLKNRVDLIRAKILNKYFVKKSCNRVELTGNGLSKLYTWLKATGEFREESIRIKYWCDFIAGHDEKTKAYLIEGLETITGFFTNIAAARLRQYTGGVDEFRMKRLLTEEIREDVLLCTRPEVLYHLNMVGSELMNEGLRQKFELTDKKIVFLPGCMRPDNGNRCQAKKRGDDLLCQNCQKNCSIGNITEIGRNFGFTTVIAVHSSGFSKTIDRLSQEKTTGFIGSACFLHLLTGGYELQRAGLNAQCVPLNFCGCARHWHEKGIQTELSVERIIELIGKKKELAA